ncbi:MAG: DoxX family protein [Planctomycetia bacterium]|nr:DoxX family protein [Planctomycetia bacterium]
MTDQCHSWTLLTGRIFLAPIFLLSGIMKISNWSETVEKMTSEGMVAAPFFLAMAILFEIAGGLMVLLGFKVRIGAAALIVFLIPATLIFHDFWNFQSPAKESQMQHFMKNLTIMGGLLALTAAGAGRFSLDALCCRSATANTHTELAEPAAR